jgi:hypothetical protein
MIYNGINKPPLGIKLNRTHRLSKGLVGCWLFNEGGGNKAYDLSGYGNHGTLENMAFPSTAASGWNPGKTGVGLNFDGTSSYVPCGNDPSLGITDAITIEAWVKVGGDSGYRGIISKDSGVAGGRQWILLVHNDNTLNFYNFDAQSDYLNVKGTQELNDNKWHHVVVVWDGVNDAGHIILYIDGQSDALTIDVEHGTFDGGYNGAYLTNIGIYGGVANFFNGSQNGIMIYNRALSAFEIRELYRDPYAMFEVDDSWVLWAGKIKTPLGTNIAAAKLLL